MAPRQNNQPKIISKKIRNWWQPIPMFNERIIQHYNNVIAPQHQLPLTSIITRPIIRKVFLATLKTRFFIEENHFTSEDRFHVITDDPVGHILCRICKDEVYKDKQDKSRKINGDQHFILPATMTFTILEIITVWCQECKVQLFKWHDKNECNKCI